MLNRLPPLLGLDNVLFVIFAKLRNAGNDWINSKLTQRAQTLTPHVLSDIIDQFDICIYCLTTVDAF